MKKRVTIGSLLLLATATFFALAPAFAGDHDVTVNVDIQSRFEHLDNLDGADAFDDDNGKGLEFTSYRLRIGLDFELTDDLSVTAEVQNAGVWGDTFVRGGLGFGGGDPINDGGGNPPLKDDTLLYQAYVDWKNVGGSSMALRIGRQEHTLGNELHLGNNDFYSGLSFDGIRAMFDFEIMDLDVFYYNIDERDVTGPLGTIGTIVPGAGPGANDTALGGITANFDVADGQTVEPYLLYYRNGMDNLPGSAVLFQYETYTLGALYMKPHEDAGFDWSIEAAFQSGDTTVGCGGTSVECDLSSTIFEGWLGYAFGGDGQHRVHVGGLLIGQGDDMVDNETFMSLFPDTHGRAGAMDLFNLNSSIFGGNTFENLTVYDVGYDWTGGPHSLSINYLSFTETEDFGAADDDIGSEIDVIYELHSGDHLALQVGMASFMPGDVIGADADDATRFWAMLRVFTR